MRKPGRAQWLFTDDGHIITLGRQWRSKWWQVHCTCGRSRRRKDGSCRHQREFMETVKPEYLSRVRLVAK